MRMVTAGLVAAWAVVLAATAAAAAEPKGGAPSGNLDLKAIGLPVVVDGRLENYVLTELRVVMARPADLQAAADREPVLRDALVREASRHPFNLPGDRLKLDDARLKASTLALARSLLGAPVARVEILSEAPRYAYYGKR
jgi:hypothetical protein